MTHPFVPVKICGLTREEDVIAAVELGAQAVGFVLYPASPRAISPERAAQLARLVSGFVTPVLLFVNAEADEIHRACQCVPGAWLQFHGDESPEFCARMAGLAGRRWLRAARIGRDGVSGPDLVNFAQQYIQADAILLDTLVSGYGGSGQTFQWSDLPPNINAHLVLSGGLTPANVAAGVQTLRGRGRSLAVDVSSGIESAKGIKDRHKIKSFIQAVRQA